MYGHSQGTNIHFYLFLLNIIPEIRYGVKQWENLKKSYHTPEHFPRETESYIYIALALCLVIGFPFWI